MYLGVPLLHQRVTGQTYHKLVERVLSRLSSWHAKSLAFVGRATLIQVVLLTIPIYTMQTKAVPSKTQQLIEKTCRRFLWGAKEGEHKASLVGWKKICQPKERGGLGFRSLKECNEAFMVKLRWQILTNKEAPWVRALRGKYMIENGHIPRLKTKTSMSWTWGVLRRHGLGWYNRSSG